MKMNRRRALVQLGVGAGAVLSFQKTPAFSWTKIPDMETLADRIRRQPRERMLEIAAAQIGKGIDYQTMLGAIFLAGLQDIEPWHVGGKLHAVMMIASILDLAESASPKEAWLGTLWNLDDFKYCQNWDLRDGDWVMKPPAKVNYANEAAARRDFLAAMDAWDLEKADHAITGLATFHSHDSLFEITGLLLPAVM